MSTTDQPGPGRPASTMRLTVRGERRKKPDWDAFVNALLLEGFRQADVSLDPMEIEMANAEETRKTKHPGSPLNPTDHAAIDDHL